MLFASITVSSIILILLIRTLVAWYICTGWKKLCVQYLLFNPSEENFNNFSSYTEMWPMHIIILEFWVWNFSKYIVNQDSMIKIIDFFKNSPQNEE